MTIVLGAVSSYVQEEEHPLLHDLPLPTLLTWARWWHLASKALVLVLKKSVWGVVGAYLRVEKGATSIRIARLRTDWSARGRELHWLDKLKQSVI